MKDLSIDFLGEGRPSPRPHVSAIDQDEAEARTSVPRRRDDGGVLFPDLGLQTQTLSSTTLFSIDSTFSIERENAMNCPFLNSDRPLYKLLNRLLC